MTETYELRTTIAMSRERHPLKLWMLGYGFGDAASGTLGATDYEQFAGKLPSRPCGESIRQIASGYRLPSWDLAFEIEAVTGISAHDLRDAKWYAREKAAS